jgi:Cdc6-like AAA superfamily ATPase
MVVSAFGLPFEGASKTDLLTRLEKFLCDVDHQGKRALLVIDEAQNLSARTVEELRMLSNFQTDDKSLLQTFLLGQPEFRATLHSPGMQQLRQRVIASYHLGPMDAQETRAYIEHRLATVGWNGDPSFDDGAHAAIYAYSGGIPRKVNTLMDRVLLMGYLEEMHAFTEADINTVISDISEEFQLPGADGDSLAAGTPAALAQDMHVGEIRTADMRVDERRASNVEMLDERMMRLEKSIVSVLSILKKIVATPQGAVTQPMDNQE